MIKKILASLILLLLFGVAQAHAMASAAYVNSSGGVTLLTYDGSGGFTELEVISGSDEFSDILSFNHKGQARLLRTSSSGIEIYDVTDGCKLIASNSSLTNLEVDDVAEYGDNILISGMGRGGLIIELNPENCEIVNEYNYLDSSDTNYDSCWSHHVAVVDGVIYADFYHEYDERFDDVFVTMDKLGNITGQVKDPLPDQFVISKNVLYARLYDQGQSAPKTGIYRVNGLNFEEVITDVYVYDKTPDGNGGLYYSAGDSEYDGFDCIYHWDGTNSTLVYDVTSLGLSGSFNDVLYDVNNSILYACTMEDELGDDGNPIWSWYALKPDGSGLITTLSCTADGSDEEKFVLIGNPSEVTSTEKISSKASAAYVNSGGGVTMIKLDSSGGLTSENVISAPSLSDRESIKAFNHKGQARLLHSSYSGTEIYDVTNGCKLIASNSSITPDNYYLKYGTVAEYGDNILLSGEGRGGFIIELNPETCEIVNEYNYVDSSNANYDSYWSSVIVANETIYAAFEDQEANEENDTSTKTFVTMDRLGNITNSREFNDVTNALSKGVIYVAEYSAGLYRLESDLSTSLILDNANSIREMTPDGSGGLYCVVSDTYGGHYIYHWDGTDYELIYDTDSFGLSYHLGDIDYDVNNSILYIRFFDDDNSDIWYAANPDGSGFITTTSFTTDKRNRFVIIGNPSEATSTANTPVTSENVSSAIEPVELNDDVIARLAALVGISPSEVKFITAENISAPQPPTESMIQYMKNDGYEPKYNLNVLTVSEDGYYVFLVNVPKDFIGKKVNEVKIYALGQKDFADSSVSASFFGLINGMLNYGELTNLSGRKINSLPAKILAIGMLKAGQPFSIFFAKKLLLALFTGGCVTGIGVFASIGCLAFFKVFRKKH